MTERTLRGQAAIIGIGESPYSRHGQAEEAQFVLALRAILAACDDAALAPTAIDGFASYADDRNSPTRLGAAPSTSTSCASP